MLFTKKYILSLVLLLAWWGFLNAQHFSVISDASVVSIKQYKDEVNSAIDELLFIVGDESFSNSFSVADYGVYIHTSDFSSGVESAFQDGIDQLSQQNQFYLFIGRFYGSEGEAEIIVDVKLPTTGSFACIPAIDREYIDDYVKAVIVSNIGDTYNANSVKSGVVSGISYLSSKLNKWVNCDCGNNLSESYNCSSSFEFEDANIQLIGLGFRKREVEVSNSGAEWDDSGGIIDYADQKIEVNGLMVSIPEQVSESKAEFDAFLTGRVYIVDNESFENGEWASVQQEVATGDFDYIEVWAIIKDGEQHYLYSGFFLKGGTEASTLRPGSEEVSRSPVALPAMKYVLQALGNAAVDACMQAVIIRILDEDVNDWGTAFEKVSYWGAAWEGVSSLLPWTKIKTGSAIYRAATSALVVVTDKAVNDDSYTVEQGLKDFTVGFGASVLTQLILHPKVVEMVGSHSTARIAFGKGLDRLYETSSYPALKSVIFAASKHFDDYVNSVVKANKYINEGEYIEGVTKIDLMGGRSSQLDPSFINIDLRETIEKGIKGDVTKLGSYIPHNSIDEIVTNNPYLGGALKAEDYIKEVAMVLKPGKKIYINGQIQNKYFKKVNQSLADQYGFDVEIYQQPLLNQFENLNFFTTNGNPISNSTMYSTVLRKQ